MFRRVMFLIFGLVLLTTGIASAAQWANTYGGANGDKAYSEDGESLEKSRRVGTASFHIERRFYVPN